MTAHAARPVPISALPAPALRALPVRNGSRTRPDGTFTLTESRGLSRAVPVQVPGACPNCGGHFVAPVPAAPGEPIRWGRCRCMRPQDQAERWNSARIPARYGGCALEGWRPQSAQQQAVLERVERWLLEAGDRTLHPTLTGLAGLVLSGEPGRGKTHLAMGALRRLVLENGRTGVPVTIRYVEPNQLLQTMKARIAGVAGEAVDIAGLLDVDVLVLDDVVAPRTEFEQSVLDELITRRWQHGGPTLVTTNLTEREAAAAFGGRAASRLSALEWLPVPGIDLRHRAAKVAA